MKNKAVPTFCMEEVQGRGNVPDHRTGFPLIKVLPPLDMGQDGTCRKSSNMSHNGRYPPLNTGLQTNPQQPVRHGH